MKTLQIIIFSLLSSIQLFSYDNQSLLNKLKNIEQNRDISELHHVLCQAIQEALEQSSDQKFQAVTAVQDFLNSSPRPEPFYFPWNIDEFGGYAWAIYPKFLRALSQVNGFSETIDPDYARLQYKQGVVSENLIKSLDQSIENASLIPILATDTHQDYYCDHDFKPAEEYYNRVNKFIKFTEEQYAYLRPVLDALRDPIAACIGSPWKVVNVRCWKTHPRKFQHDPSGGWHLDGFPYDVKKIMLYPRGCSHEKGTTQLEFSPHLNISGPPGTWLLFENSKLSHRAIAPKLKKGALDRLVVEITIVPHYEFDLEPVSAGLLAMWPLSPW